MSTFDLPIQQAVYTRLVSEVSSATIYDDVPNSPPGEPRTDHPFVVVGQDTITPWDTDDQLGGDAFVNLHVWSRYEGKKEIKEIMQEIYDALNRQAANLSATGYRFVDCLFDYSEVNDRNDGETRHGLIRFKILIEKE